MNPQPTPFLVMRSSCDYRNLLSCSLFSEDAYVGVMYDQSSGFWADSCTKAYSSANRRLLPYVSGYEMFFFFFVELPQNT